MASGFTFVNTVNAPALSPSSAKAMRAHVTKTNFANRRKRIDAESVQKRKDTSVENAFARLMSLADNPIAADAISILRSQHPWQIGPDSGSSNQPRRTKQERSRLSKKTNAAEKSWDEFSEDNYDMLALMRPADPFVSLSFLIHHFAPVMFPSEVSPVEKPGHQLWASLLVNEPAFCEATLAIGISYRPVSTHDGRMSTPEIHAGNAISIINRRLSDPKAAVSDGVLAAVFSLATWELKLGNEKAWAIHIDGLAKMIAVRNTSGVNNLPTWFSDVLIYNGFSLHTPSKRLHYQKVLDALTVAGHARTLDISTISSCMIQLRGGLSVYHSRDMTPDAIFREIQQPIEALHSIAQRLKHDNHGFLRASGYAIIVFLHLSWPDTWAGKSREPLSTLASDLREALEQSQVKLCSTIDLVVWKFFMGGVASSPQSEARTWFVDRLLRIVRTIPVFQWNEMLEMLERAFLPSEVLLEKCRKLWDEVQAKWYCVRSLPAEGEGRVCHADRNGWPVQVVDWSNLRPGHLHV